MKILLVMVLGFLILSFIAGYLIFRLPAFGTPPDGEHKKKIAKSKNYNLEQDIFLNRQPHLIAEMKKENFNLKDLIKWFREGEDRIPKDPLPEMKPDLKEFLIASDDLKVIWLGHSTFLMNLAGKIILVDPVFGESAAPFSFMVRRFQPPALSLEELPKIDYIVISHDHYDHLDIKAMKFFAKKDVKFLAPLGISSHLNRWGVDSSKITELDWWESTTLGDIEFISTPAQHFSGRNLWEENKTLWTSWVIRGAGLNIYFSGDSGYDVHFKEIGDKYGPFDIAFIENGQYNVKWQAVHVLPEEAVQAYFDLRAKRFFPIHWGMFTLAFHTWREPIDELSRLSKEKGVNLVTPQLGQMIQINEEYKNTEWWN